MPALCEPCPVPRFPTRSIRAGEELTYDYKYQVGSVPDKEIRCYCGAKKCRGRLL